MAKALLGLALSFFFAFSVAAATTGPKQPNWAQMSPEDRQILAPLESRWDGFTAQRKKMWLGIAKSYPTMPPEEQAKVQRRLESWVKLSQAERRTVREGYKDLQKLPPEKKQTLKQQWDEYNKLPEEERRRLSSSAKVPPPKAPAATVQ